MWNVSQKSFRGFIKIALYRFTVFFSDFASSNLKIRFLSCYFNPGMACTSPARRKRELHEESGLFQEKWELRHFCTMLNKKLECLICHNFIATPKEYNLNRHYGTNRLSCHEYEGRVCIWKLKALKVTSTDALMKIQLPLLQAMITAEW